MGGVGDGEWDPRLRPPREHLYCQSHRKALLMAAAPHFRIAIAIAFLSFTLLYIQNCFYLIVKAPKINNFFLDTFVICSFMLSSFFF